MGVMRWKRYVQFIEKTLAGKQEMKGEFMNG